ncbi:MAG: exodeoxyribonuclease III [Gammaproteobacteria bacterium]|jgi:exodeoxyribonuclease-3|nr:exodeoxyribonuclease III [Gammaproteobacteria bacterium]MBU0787113.1 exodeoxyribonuclease III [Gammaproteobacteria bacterium]MBU0816364.1 exodeoxyribonuclease III [Gammaproteobacteria bacterium]MBU1788001.1 exodeoxyribonuclease III [Gammaproteobacteria bacterium]
MKLATWNVNSLNVRLPQVLDWLAAQQSSGAAVDVLALQELKLTDDKFPFEAFSQIGYQAQCFGQKTYNGVALLTREPATDVVKNIPGFSDDMARVISANVQGVRVIGAYFPNGQEPGSDKFDYKMNWLKGLRDWVREELAKHPKLVLMGDYNITFDDADVWDPVGLKDSIHCTEEERYQLRALIALGLHDAYRLFPQAEKSYSWWDYRNFGFRRNQGLRIDHILVSHALKPLVKACVIDKSPRKNERPSDHAPVIVEVGNED